MGADAMPEARNIRSISELIFASLISSLLMLLLLLLLLISTLMMNETFTINYCDSLLMLLT